MKDYLECGKVVGSHGVKGGCKVESLCDSPRVLCGFDTVYLKAKDGSYSPLKVRQASVYKGMGLLYFEGYDTPEATLPLRTRMLYVKREQIPLEEGAFLLADLIGLPVSDIDSGRVYGTLTAVDTMPASTVYTVTAEDGREVLIPAVAEFIKEVDPASGVKVRLIPGFFDEV